MKHKGLLMKNLFFILLFSLLFTGCADTVSLTDAASIEPVGFLHGLWHGFIIPFSFIVSLFSDTSIYAIYNNGGWYDFGFMIGLGAFSGIGFARHN